ncbi:MAG: energy transducer TonB [Bacteroidales bacterium]|nr:energy transducer TonB [Bacteroidales bacterium]
MARDIQLNSPEWCDLVFEGKNKAYGAYELRQSSPKRHFWAFIIVAACTLLAYLIPYFIRLVTPEKDREMMVEVTTLSDIKMDMPEQKEEPKALQLEPPPPPLKSTIKFTPPVIKADEKVRDQDEMKSQAELTESKVSISVADVKGTDEVNGKDIAELRENQQIANEAAEEKIFEVAEQAPSFPGGQEALLKWIQKELRYPAAAAESGVQGRVIIQFVVGKSGDIRDVKVARSVDPDLDREALRVVKGMPKWIPGMQSGEAVSVRFTLPVYFKLQ